MFSITQEPCDETVVRSRPATGTCSKTRGRWVLAATILASSMAFIDSTVVNVALPALQTGLKATAIDVQWVVEAYSLLLSALLLVGGSLGDHYGRRRIFLIGTALFAAASVACGFAANIHQLIAARAFQGFGAALLVPGSLAIISTSFGEAERGRAIGTWSGFSAITTAIGPVMGGWLIEHVSWRAVFFINLPIALLVIAISTRHVAESSDKESARIDWLGAILVTAGLAALVYGLIESSRVGFDDRTVVSVLIAAVVLLTLFLLAEQRVAYPMLPLTLFRSTTFGGANLLTFFLYAALSGTLFFLPLNLIQIQHYPATAAGAALLPFIVIMWLLSRWSGGLVTQYGARAPLIIGPLIAAAGFGLFIVPGVHASYWTGFFPATVVLGLGMAVSVAPLTTAVMNSVGQNRVGVASGINNAIARSAGLLAIAVLGIVMLHVFSNGIERRARTSNLPASTIEFLEADRTRLGALAAPEEAELAIRAQVQRVVEQSFIAGFRVVMAIGAALALASSLTSVVFIGRKPGEIK